MTNDREEKKTKKLTLGGSKLSLSRKSIYPKNVKKTLGNSGAIVVEVKHGKAARNGLSFNKEDNTSSNIDQSDRRITALQKSKITSKEEETSKVSTLSELAEINQDLKIDNDPVIEDTSTKDFNEDNKKDASLKKEQYKKPSVDLVVDTKDEKFEEEKVAPTKPKIIEPKKLKKLDILNMLNDDSGGTKVQTRSLSAIKRAKAKEKRKNDTSIKTEKLYREVILPEVITVSELASHMTEKSSDVTRELMKLGIMATGTQSIDADTAELVATSFGHTVKRVKESDIEDTLNNIADSEESLQARAPIVTVMGHVDHGKTSLLDALKSTDVVTGEAGGITQHIGAYTVTTSSGKMITFIDTPGHEAFTEMRTRGAKVTDIVILVVAADDGIKTQTIEAISHAKAANVPIIVAINKVDKPGADVEKVKNELLAHELIPEDLGGDIITVEVSAKQKLNLDKLEEFILLVAEMQELKANPNAVASGVVIESRMHASRGVISTVIIQRGTLKKGDIILAGNSYGRVKRVCNDKGRTIQAAGPSIAVEVFGLDSAPSAGNLFNVVETDKKAKDIIDYRKRKARDLQVTASKTSLEELFLKASGESKEKNLAIIIKGDVHGSIEAIVNSLNKIESDEVKLKILHSAVGGITESDVNLATASGALILGFNVRPNSAAALDAENNKVDIRYYSVIYDLIDDIKLIMSGMLSPIIREEYIGSVDIREVFNISKTGKIAGSYVTKGIIKRGAGIRLLRDNIVIHEGKLKTLKRFKDDVKEVREGFECGIAFENYHDIKIGDSVEVFDIVEEQKKL